MKSLRTQTVLNRVKKPLAARGITLEKGGKAEAQISAGVQLANKGIRKFNSAAKKGETEMEKIKAKIHKETSKGGRVRNFTERLTEGLRKQTEAILTKANKATAPKKKPTTKKK